MIRCGILAAVMLGLLGQQSYAQSSAIQTLRDTYVACVNNSFNFRHLNDYVRDGNVQAAVERSFADCRAEENALTTTGAIMMTGPIRPAEDAMLRARALVDQLKVKIKSGIVAGLQNVPSGQVKK